MVAGRSELREMEAENEYSPGLCFCRPGNYGLKPENRQDHRDRHGDRAKWPGGAGVFRFSQSLPAASAGDGGTDRNPG